MAAHAYEPHGVAVDTLTLATDEQGVQVNITLQGSGAVCVSRRYSGEEILMPESYGAPRVSLFPAVPIEDDRWKLFYLSVCGDVDVTYPDGGEWHTLKAPEKPAPADVPEKDTDAEAEKAAVPVEENTEEKTEEAKEADEPAAPDVPVTPV